MTILAISFLIIGFVIILLVLATIFKKHKRTIIWSGAIAIFLTLCALFATEVFKPEEDTTHNAVLLAVSTMMLGISAVLIIAAEKPEKLLWKNLFRRKRNSEDSLTTNQPNNTEKLTEQMGPETKATDVLITDNSNLNGVRIPRGLNTTLARQVFSNAIEAGYISLDGEHLVWNDSTVLCAYMCGRIYCKDKAEKIPRENKCYWAKGNTGFPNAELTRLFRRDGIGQARQNRNFEGVPKKYEEIDKFFERS